MTQFTPTPLPTLLQRLPQGADSATAQRIMRAYAFAERTHAGRQHETGISALEFDLCIAENMVALGVDSTTIVAALLHDILDEQTGVTEKKLAKEFGKDVASLVSGLATLDAYAQEVTISTQPGVEPQAPQLEKIRRAILAIIEGDIRIILIRMAVSLQTLRFAQDLPTDRQVAVASEAMHIYAPLANRLGIWQLKWELEDLSFRYLQPAAYKEIATKLAARRAERASSVENAATALREKIEETEIKAAVKGRPKHIYSIYRKMMRKKLDFEQIYDVQALRVILEPKDPDFYKDKSSKEIDEAERGLCYQVLGMVHSIWQPIPREFDDYIAAPKPNGYKSLHTAVIDPGSGQTLEVQIRTKRMHEEAEKGVAAHWAYKEGGNRVSSFVQRQIQGMRDLLQAMRDNSSDTEESDLLDAEVLAERIYVFTPKGDVVDLPAGATPIDFAYQIHTEVGHRCRGARIDGKMVGLDYELKSGQRVEVVTASRPGPSRDWMNPNLGYTSSARTRSKIRQWFRNQDREKNIEQGRELVERELKRLGLQDDYKIDDIAIALHYDDEAEFLAKVGFGDIQSAQISGALIRLQDNLKPDDELRPLLLRELPKSKGLTVLGESGLHTRMAKCCNPIPPEPIIGYTTRGQGVTIHRRDCNQVAAITDKERLIEVSWGQESETYPIPLVVRAFRRTKLVDDILNILRGQRIQAPKTKTLTADNVVSIYLIVEIESLEQLNWLLSKLENLPNVIEARRQRWS